MEYPFLLTTDHFQFYLADAQYQTDTSTIWTDAALARQVAYGADMLAVGTMRYGGETQVIIELRDESSPHAGTDIADSPTGRIHIPSGTLVLFAPESDMYAAPRLAVPSGVYVATVVFEHEDRVVDEEARTGEDVYRVVLQRA